jgi:DNA-binding NtrC family response regulator
LVRLLTVDVLKDAGLQAEEAGTFHEARAKIRSLGSQLAGAIIDLGLPDRPGHELVADVRALRANLPVILATGYADEDVRRRFAQDAFLQIITKPFDPESLVAILAKFSVRSRIAMKAK